MFGFISKSGESHAFLKLKKIALYPRQYAHNSAGLIEKLTRKVKKEELIKIANSDFFPFNFRYRALELIDDKNVLEKIASTYAGFRTPSNDIRIQACEKLGHIMDENTPCFCKRCNAHIHKFEKCKCIICGFSQHVYYKISYESLPENIKNAADDEMGKMVGVYSEVVAHKCDVCGDIKWHVYNRD